MTMLIECFHLQNEILVNGVQNINQIVIIREILIRFVGNRHVYLALDGNCFIAALAIWAHEVLFNI